MMLTSKGRYAVMAMVDLAIHSKGRPVNLNDIADRQEITVAYLEQIFARLKAAGLVQSVRGPGGGYLLSATPNTIDVASIVMAQDEKIKMTRCNNHKEGCMSDKARCLTHDLWDGLGNSIKSYLSTITLEDITHRRVNTDPIIENHVETKAQGALQ